MTEIERNDVILMLRSVAQEMMLHESISANWISGWETETMG